MSKIVSMGHFTAIGMRTPVEDPRALIINTCGKNDTSERGTPQNWAWSNPTNRAITHYYQDITAVSVECLWQGTKLQINQTHPDPEILNGNWRKNKGKRPIGAYTGINNPPITNPGDARKHIYLPAFQKLIDHWLNDPQVNKWINDAKNHTGPVYLRDHDTGRGLYRNGPMSHAWVLATWLNTGNMPNE